MPAYPCSWGIFFLLCATGDPCVRVVTITGDDETNGDDEGECEFDSQRQDAIKELSTTTKKVFGGGTKEIKDGGRKGRSNTAQAVPLSSPPNDDSSVKGKDNSETSAKGRRGGGGSDPIEASLSDTLRGERRGKKGRKGAKGEGKTRQTLMQ